jgi:Spy/CpxP family protein refolding chaperone
MRPFLLALLTVLAAAPIAVSAQQAPAPAYARVNPSGQTMYDHWVRRLTNENLSQQQQTQIGNLIYQYAQQHPQGSPVDRASRRALVQQIIGVLTPQQRAQFQQEAQARRAARMQRREQMQQQQQQQPPN